LEAEEIKSEIGNRKARWERCRSAGGLRVGIFRFHLPPRRRRSQAQLSDYLSEANPPIRLDGCNRLPVRSVLSIPNSTNHGQPIRNELRNREKSDKSIKI
jgi:hypothetical protein